MRSEYTDYSTATALSTVRYETFARTHRDVDAEFELPVRVRRVIRCEAGVTIRITGVRHSRLDDDHSPVTDVVLERLTDADPFAIDGLASRRS